MSVGVEKDKAWLHSDSTPRRHWYPHVALGVCLGLRRERGHRCRVAGQDRGADDVLLEVYPRSREVTVGWGLVVGLQTSVDGVHVPGGALLGFCGRESPRCEHRVFLKRFLKDFKVAVLQETSPNRKPTVPLCALRERHTGSSKRPESVFPALAPGRH